MLPAVGLGDEAAVAAVVGAHPGQGARAHDRLFLAAHDGHGHNVADVGVQPPIQDGGVAQHALPVVLGQAALGDMILDHG